MTIDVEIERLIERAIQEDIRAGDLTSESLIKDSSVITARFVLKQAGVVAGLSLIPIVYSKLKNTNDKAEPDVKFQAVVPEGSYHKSGTIIATLQGPASLIIKAERIVLTLLQHASGIATITSAYVKKVAGTGCAIMDTRKTLPGLRALEKYAVRIGGGINHRFDLSDRLVIKRNHKFFLNESKISLSEAAAILEKKYPEHPYEIEVDTFEILADALKTKAEAIILTHLTPDEMTRFIPQIRRAGKKIYVDNGSRITLDTVHAYAKKGVDAIAIGALTHSVQALDIGLRLS